MTKRAFIFTGQGEKIKVKSPQLTTFWTSVALAKNLIANGITPDATAGLSLGEFASLAIANVFGLEDLEQILHFRQQVMNRDLNNSDTGMVACIGPSLKKLKSEVKNYNLAITNYNSPTQIVVGGKKSELERFKETASKHYSISIINLPTIGAFHSEYLNKANEGMKDFLQDFAAQSPTIPIYHNLTGNKGSNDIKETIAQHLSHPVKFQKIIENMLQDGIDEFVSIGIGTAPVGLIRDTCKAREAKVKIYKVENLADIERLCS